ncbi:hypothetical protein ANN_16022 [Periplaneta americana]|uniref:Uncharacterized protein n=1 Tax=Periplaneta americana TaxID=6978 RepID=A0ABQ8SIR5_PERAM|nr:hypothetical protein ANN_16022 [Periplaneta americana]
MDFILWGGLKEKMYTRKLRDLDILEAVIREECAHVQRICCNGLSWTLDPGCKGVLLKLVPTLNMKWQGP